MPKLADLDNKELFQRLAEYESRLLEIINEGRMTEEIVVMLQQEVTRRGIAVTEPHQC